jgi:hypothetical protein
MVPTSTTRSRPSTTRISSWSIPAFFILRRMFLRNFLSFLQMTVPSGATMSTDAFCWNSRSAVVSLNQPFLVRKIRSDS